MPQVSRFVIYPAVAVIAAIVIVLAARLDSIASKPKVVHHSVEHEHATRIHLAGKTNGRSTSYRAARGVVRNTRRDSIIQREDLHEAIHRSGQYLVRVNLENGQFVYREHLDGKETKQTYNMLRHAGTLYALARYYRWQPDESTLAALKRGTVFLRGEMTSPSNRQDLLALWTRPAVTGKEGPETAKLGGAGLALLALACLKDIDGDAVTTAEMRALGEFVLFMQKDDGSFYSKYIPSQGGKSDTFVSLYYPGEAILGLIRLYQIDPQPKWLESAYRGMAHLAHRRANAVQVEADHWALIATSELLPQLTAPGDGVSRELLVQHAAQICSSILAQRPPFPPEAHEHGGFSFDGRTCPTATRLEGLLACLTFLPDERQELIALTSTTVKDGMNFLLRSQVASGHHSGAVPRAIHRLPVGHPFHSRKFNRRAAEVRIDYVQHALCAMIDYDEYLSQRPLMK